VAKKKSLVIVESPAKARTIGGYLGNDYVVESSIGHVRDLPRGAADVPEKFKGLAWARLGVDVDNDFKPLYVVDADKKAHIRHLKELLKGAGELLLATDEDREGESIAWHLLEILKPSVPVKRMAFHEITKKAILSAVETPREVDRKLVQAQEARRILDRLYGYEVSPVLWKKVMPKLSAGRVQSVATRIIVQREIERMHFTAATYWDVDATFQTPEGGDFAATLTVLRGQRLATGKDFDDSGRLTAKDVVLVPEERARALVTSMQDAEHRVTQVERKPNRRSPAPPFMTSTLQQEASRKLRFSSARTMRAAQSLYEAGFITYMRTDSTTLSSAALDASRREIEKLYGKEYLPAEPRVYRKKVKNAQEAHEAIRPAGDSFQHPSAVSKKVGKDEERLYELIWKRTVASQMQDARGESVRVLIQSTAKDGTRCEFGASGNTILFPGFLRAYVEGTDDPAAELEQRDRPLPKLDEGQDLVGKGFEPKGHETQPPARFTEASLVRRLEELGVGRPSTYASIMSTIQARGYVWKKGSALVPSFKAFAVVRLLEQHFGRLVDYEFTAKMEDDLDSIANGEEQMVPWLQRFYFGTPDPKASVTDAKARDQLAALGLRALAADQLGVIDAREINSIPLGEDSEGVPIVIRVGRYGPYLQRGEDTATLSEEIAPDELTVEKALELLSAPSGDRDLGKDAETGLTVYARSGRFGAYVQLGEPGGKEKPKTASLLKTMSLDTITLEDALKMLSLPRTVGEDSEGRTVTTALGRYGPYVSNGKDNRTLESEEQVFTLTLEQAQTLFAQPRQRGRGPAKEPLKTLDADGVSGKVITLREGRFGLYVTDGETNASLRKGDSVESIDQARAEELLQLRRERGPSKKKRPTRKKSAGSPASGDAPATKRAATKKPSTKKAAAKKPATKKPATKAATKKPASTVTKKPASKKAATKKAATKKAATKKPVKKSTKKSPASKAPSRKKK